MAGSAIAVPLPVAPQAVQRSQWRMAYERFRAHRPAVAAVVVLGALAALSAAAPLVSPYDATKVTLAQIYDRPPSAHPSGTDALGRHLRPPTPHAGRGSLAVAALPGP